MDKDVMKRLLRDAGIPIPKFSVFHRHQRSLIKFDELKATLGDTIFVKPANMGSSVGVSRVRSTQELEAAITEAFRYDTKILIEQGVTGREIEVSVLGNEHPEASLPGEIMPKDGFYSYDAKYIDDQGARLDMPAKLSPELTAAAQKVAIETFQCLCCEGLSRVDLFLTPDNRFLVNEINTLPGFTSISMYPKLWEISGLSYSKLLDKLIQLALERHERDSELAMGPDGARANA
jgi:D-alanine-D-alanine ligase